MSRILHLSDLHFGDEDRLQARVYEGLLDTLGTIKGVDLLVVTGDVFDSFQATAKVLDGFTALLEQVFAALGGPVTTLLVPGNHDRRDDGVFGPWSGELFHRLAERLRALPTVYVLGNRTPLLAERVDVPGLPAEVVCYDSAYLPRGLVSAGGNVREQDLLQLGAELAQSDPERPLVFLLHHHLVPTSVTDTSLIRTAGRPLWQRVLVGGLLPLVVGNADREELTMTALGAGTALSTLATLGRAVLVLHGHKHFPTARLLKGLADDADLLVTGAGSCGKAQDFSTGGTDWDDAPRLWPSLNLVDLTAEGVEVLNQAWSPTDPGLRNSARVLASVKREGSRWVPRPPPPPRPWQPVLSLNESEITLKRSGQFLDRYDLDVHRRVRVLAAGALPEYRDLVEGPRGSTVVDILCGAVDVPDAKCPVQLEVPLDGGAAAWRVRGAVYATAAGAVETHGPGAAFEWVGLLNRSRAEVVRLKVNLGPVKTTPFASATDLTTGKERPLVLRREGDWVVAEVPRCPSRVLVRVYWPL